LRGGVLWQDWGMHAGSHRLSPDEFWSRVDETDERLRASFEPAGAFGLVEWPGFAMVTDWDYSGHTRVLTFAHELPTMGGTAAAEGPSSGAGAGAAAGARASAESGAPGQGEGEDAFEVHVHWREGDSRSVVDRLRRRAAGASGLTGFGDDSGAGALSGLGSAHRLLSPAEGLPDRIEFLELDGLEQPFELWERGDRWWAATTFGGRTLAVEARGVSPEAVALCRVSDVEPYLEGRRAWLRRVRDET
jgi:hypothetical protein